MKMPQEKHGAIKMAKDYIDKDPTDRDDEMGLSSEIVCTISCCVFVQGAHGDNFGLFLGCVDFVLVLPQSAKFC